MLQNEKSPFNKLSQSNSIQSFAQVLDEILCLLVSETFDYIFFFNLKNWVMSYV